MSITPHLPSTRTLHFFLYDTVKIALLLSGVIFVATIPRSSTSIERTGALLGGRHQGVGNALAAGLGVVTPFCSCSAVPAFIGFVAAGPTSSPECPSRLSRGAGGQVIDTTAGLTFGQRVQMGAEKVGSILHRIWPYLLAGIGLGAVIHGWAPEDLFARYAGAGSTYGVLVAVLVGIPLHSNAAGILPLVEALHDKGLPMGTLLAFMMAVVALSLPEMILLRRVLKPQLSASTSRWSVPRSSQWAICSPTWSPEHPRKERP